MPSPLRGLALMLAALLGVAACAGSPMVRAAREGDRAALRRDALAATAGGTKRTLDDDADVAHAVVAYEIESAPGVDDAIARIHDVRACAFRVDDVLEERMKAGDAASAEAALERLETGALGEGAAREYATRTDDRWRAVAMWGMTRADDHDTRRRGLLDGSPLVRRSALHAVVDRDDGTDFEAVLDVARHDPEPLVRATAVRALARLAGAPPDLAIRLRDLWTNADEGLREDLASVFASPAVARAGGAEALRHLLGASEGNTAVGIAGVILRSRIDDAALRASAASKLTSAVKSGGHRARIHAIAIAPLEHAMPPLVEALIEAAGADDVDVKVAALGRLVDARSRAVSPNDRQGAREALEQLAVPDALMRPTASRARSLLADAGDLRVQGWVEADLKSPDADTRMNAARALVALGRASRALPLLADDDASVRTHVACAILLRARLR